MKYDPIIATDLDGKDYLFDSKYVALMFIRGYKPSSGDVKTLTAAIESGRTMSGWKFRNLDNNEKDYYEKVLRQQGGQEYGPDPRPESGTSNSGE